MKLIIETDIGHDPDDLFAICYLIAAGVEIKAVTIVPGDPDQIAIAKLIRKECGLDFPIGASKLDRTALSSGSIHHGLLGKFGCKLNETPDGFGPDVVKQTLAEHPDCELFVIGPVTSVAKCLQQPFKTTVSRATLQGGFLPYSLSQPKVRLEKFEGKEWMPTFNLNGDRIGGQFFINTDKINERRYVGKNICHTIEYNAAWHEQLRPNGTAAAALFKLGMDMYLKNHDSKKFHDPTAAVCLLHQNIGEWFNGHPVKMEGGWSTKGLYNPEKNDWVLADIDRDSYWEHLCNFR